MKKLKFGLDKFIDSEVLSREELKKVGGGSAPPCPTGKFWCSCIINGHPMGGCFDSIEACQQLCLS